MELQVIWMQYKSTRDSQLRYSAAQVIAQGISAEGGLFVPETLPDLSGQLEELSRLDYRTLAKEIFGCFSRTSRRRRSPPAWRTPTARRNSGAGSL